MTRRAVAVLIAAVFVFGACGDDGGGTAPPTSGVPTGADTGGRTPSGGGGTNPTDNQPSGGSTE